MAQCCAVFWSLRKSRFAATSEPGSDVIADLICFSLERRIMNKLNTVASLFATRRPVSASGAFARCRQLVNNTGTVWKNARTNSAGAMPTGRQPPPRKAATARQRPPAPAPARRPPRPAPAPACSSPGSEACPVAPAAPTSEVTFAADAFFDTPTRRCQARRQGQAGRPDQQDGGHQPQVIIAVGHADSDGSDAYNQKLSVRRARQIVRTT